MDHLFTMALMLQCAIRPIASANVTVSNVSVPSDFTLDPSSSPTIASDSPTPNPTKAPTNWKYIGCFVDNQYSRAMDDWGPGSGYILETCYDRCSSWNYLYFGLQNHPGVIGGYECSCDNSYGDATRYGPSDACNDGNYKQDINALYENLLLTASTPTFIIESTQHTRVYTQYPTHATQSTQFPFKNPIYFATIGSTQYPSYYPTESPRYHPTITNDKSTTMPSWVSVVIPIGSVIICMMFLWIGLLYWKTIKLRQSVVDRKTQGISDDTEVNVSTASTKEGTSVYLSCIQCGATSKEATLTSSVYVCATCKSVDNGRLTAQDDNGCNILLEFPITKGVIVKLPKANQTKGIDDDDTFEMKRRGTNTANEGYSHGT